VVELKLILRKKIIESKSFTEDVKGLRNKGKPEKL
jgi:hypothetical protein